MDKIVVFTQLQKHGFFATNIQIKMNFKSSSFI